MYWIWYTPITLYYDDVEIDNETNKDSNDNQTGKTTRGLASGGADKNKVNEEKKTSRKLGMKIWKEFRFVAVF